VFRRDPTSQQRRFYVKWRLLKTFTETQTSTVCLWCTKRENGAKVLGRQKDKREIGRGKKEGQLEGFRYPNSSMMKMNLHFQNFVLGISLRQLLASVSTRNQKLYLRVSPVWLPYMTASILPHRQPNRRSQTLIYLTGLTNLVYVANSAFGESLIGAEDRQPKCCEWTCQINSFLKLYSQVSFKRQIYP